MNNSFVLIVGLYLVGLVLAQDPCKPYDPPVPDFSAPGRRISVQKCYEYIWNIKYRLDKSKREKECAEQKRVPMSLNGRAGGVKAVPQIINGMATVAGDYPHMAAIGWLAVDGSWSFRCGGSLISDKFVLTAAHCTKSPLDSTIVDPIPKIVRIGDKNIRHDPHRFHVVLDDKIINITDHPKYRPTRRYYDIALMELEFAVVFSSLKHPACLWTHPEENSYKGKVLITGWGVIDVETEQTSDELQVAEVDLIDQKTCNKLLTPMCSKKFCGLMDNQMCAGLIEGGKDSCQGDSGGPLQIEIHLPTTSEGRMHYVLGVTSFGRGCAQANFPGVYTRVASYIDWIEKIVWD